MKKYIPYIVILLLTYLVVGFIKMQFNPVYWKSSQRATMLMIAVCLMLIYRIIKFIDIDVEE